MSTLCVTALRLLIVSCQRADRRSGTVIIDILDRVLDQKEKNSTQKENKIPFHRSSWKYSVQPRAYPKGRNLSRVSPSTLKKNLALINARPKKVLGFQKPVDLFEQNLKICCT